MSGEYTYVSTQATNCASCGLHKHTPLRVDWMGGYVCLTCIDRVMESIPAEPPLDDDNAPIIYDTNEVDQLTHDLTGDEGEEDSVTVLRRLVNYVENVWPGKTAKQVLTELEESTAGVLGKESEHG